MSASVSAVDRAAWRQGEGLSRMSRSGGDDHGAAQHRLGNRSVGRGFRGGRLRDVDDPDLVHPQRRRRRDRERSLPGAVHHRQEPAIRVRQPPGHRDRRGDVALRRRVRDLDGAHVVRVRPRRRYSGVALAAACGRPASHARDCHDGHRGAERGDLSLRRRVVRGHFDQHDLPLSRLCNPDLPQPEESVAGGG